MLTLPAQRPIYRRWLLLAAVLHLPVSRAIRYTRKFKMLPYRATVKKQALWIFLICILASPFGRSLSGRPASLNLFQGTTIVPYFIPRYLLGILHHRQNPSLSTTYTSTRVQLGQTPLTLLPVCIVSPFPSLPHTLRHGHISWMEIVRATHWVRSMGRCTGTHTIVRWS